MSNMEVHAFKEQPIWPPFPARRTHIPMKKVLDVRNAKNARNARPRIVDRTETLELVHCFACNGHIRKRHGAKPKTRVLFRIWNNAIEKVKYVRPRYYCPNCKADVLPEIRDALPNMKFDFEIIGLILALNADRGMGCRCISKAFSSLFGIGISPASVSNILKKMKAFSSCRGLERKRK